MYFFPSSYKSPSAICVHGSGRTSNLYWNQPVETVILLWLQLLKELFILHVVDALDSFYCDDTWHLSSSKPVKTYATFNGMYPSIYFWATIWWSLSTITLSAAPRVFSVFICIHLDDCVFTVLHCCLSFVFIHSRGMMHHAGSYARARHHVFDPTLFLLQSATLTSCLTNMQSP